MFPTGEHPPGFLLFWARKYAADRVDYKITDFRGGLRAAARPLRFGTMRDREVIDSELRPAAA